MIFVLLSALVLLLLWVVRTVNSIRKNAMKVAESYSGIEVALAKRYDVLIKLLDSAQGYLRWERSVFLRTVQLRSGMRPEEIEHAEERMDAVSEQILSAVQREPELHSEQVIGLFQAGIADAEAQVAAARRIYNSNVQIYNTQIESFPGRYLAGKRSPAPFFQEKSGIYQDLKFKF